MKLFPIPSNPAFPKIDLVKAGKLAANVISAGVVLYETYDLLNNAVGANTHSDKNNASFLKETVKTIAYITACANLADKAVKHDLTSMDKAVSMERLEIARKTAVFVGSVIGFIFSRIRS